MSKRSRVERDRLARQVQEVLNEGTKTAAEVAEMFNVSIRSVRRYKKASVILREKLENPLDVLRLFHFTEKELKECKDEVRSVIAQQKEIKKRWDRYYGDRKNRATATSPPSTPKPPEEYKPHLILEATKLLALFEKTRIVLGQEIGAVPKKSGTLLPPMPTDLPVLPGGNGADQDDLLTKVSNLPKGQREKTIAVVRQAWRELKILKSGN